MKEIIVLITAILMFSSCSKDDIESNGVLGNWKSETSSEYPKFTFRSDKTFSWSTNSSNTNNGTYRISGSNLFLNYGGEMKFNFSAEGGKLMFSRNDEVFGEALGSNYSLIKDVQ